MNRSLLKNGTRVNEEKILQSIYLLRSKKIMLDRDLAALYGVETRVLNQAVKRNLQRFPDDFMFQLNPDESRQLISQIVISTDDKTANHGGLRKLPFAFTEMGVAMLSSVLRSETAIAVNIQIIRTFTKMREMLMTHKEILLHLEQLEQKMKAGDARHQKLEKEIEQIFQVLKNLISSPAAPRRRIGFIP